MSAAIAIQNGEAAVVFGAPWSIPDYGIFLKTKLLPESKMVFDIDADTYTITTPERFASILGLATPQRPELETPISAFLFDYQAWVTRKAIEAKRFAVWMDCGRGKTPVALEFAVHVGQLGRVLFVVPNKIVHQWQDESAKFYGDQIPLQRLNSRDEIKEWCVSGAGYAITNHEKFIAGPIDECRNLRGFILDESSILKSGMGKIKRSLCESAEGIEFKLSLSATPAPNDTTEYVTQAEFLESGGREMLAEFFFRNYDGQVWILRPHAKDSFYRFMSSWSVYLRNPSAYGFKNTFDVPEPELNEVKLTITKEQLEAMNPFAFKEGNLLMDEKLGVTARSKLSQIAKGFVYGRDEAEKKTITRINSTKPGVVAELVIDAIAEGKQVLVWTVFDEESEIIMDQLEGVSGVESLHGEDTEDDCDDILERFRNGQVRALVSKAKLLGFGMNFQFCTRMIFSGFDDSFEAFYQAVRRAHRYGQTEPVKVFIPYIPELESHMWNNLLRKKSQWESDIATQEKNYVEAMNL